MRTLLPILAVTLILTLLAPGALRASCGHCGPDCRHDHAKGDAAAPTGEAKTSEEDGSQAATPGTTADASEAAFACPMHPEVTSKEPSDCPKCGMKLEPVKAKEAPAPGEAAPAGSVK